MNDRKTSKLPFDSEDLNEQKLWQALGDLPDESPSPRLRQSFYRELEKADRESWLEKLNSWLGIRNATGWVTAMAFGVLGLGLAQWMNTTNIDIPGTATVSDPVEDSRLAVLEQNVARLNRQLVLDRLQDSAASTRLRGVFDAGGLVEDDPEVTRALLLRATEDRVPSVRSAAIDALGPKLNSASVGSELMNLLEQAEAPLVQLALVDLVLRYGSQAQIEQLLALANQDRLLPELVNHVKKSLQGEVI